jgi:hypothetical protein
MCPVRRATAALTVPSASSAGGLKTLVIPRFRHRLREIFRFRMRENIHNKNYKEKTYANEPSVAR